MVTTIKLEQCLHTIEESGGLEVVATLKKLWHILSGQLYVLTE